ncbi:hypothetical protein NHX12_025083 [Muraenolepis orangiensis]|uniref:Uncharacterized protein n=1 Tax=Muraenolepis orangiensis TaxID=630683 RepID=A0A9Q0EKM1_9TELE|nr:hypothetical protein NHX12_025083 [Muraenolepis orangiensis]
MRAPGVLILSRPVGPGLGLMSPIPPDQIKQSQAKSPTSDPKEGEAFVLMVALLDDSVSTRRFPPPVRPIHATQMPRYLGDPGRLW